jgi:hypothetical protein
VSGEKYASLLDPAFIAFGFIFGNAHADEGTDEAAHPAAEAEASQGPHDRAGGDERSYARNCQRAYPR